MTLKKISAILIIFIIAFIAWMILGASTSSRTNERYYRLEQEVANLYGHHLALNPPLLYQGEIEYSARYERGQKVAENYKPTDWFELSSSDIHIAVTLDQRKKGNLWFPTFKTEIDSHYQFQLEKFDPDEPLYIRYQLQSTKTIYSNLTLMIDDVPYDDFNALIGDRGIEIVPTDDNMLNIDISYDATGMQELMYFLTDSGDDSVSQINDFQLRIDTDFEDYDIVPETMSPTDIRKYNDGYQLSWQFDNAITGKNIGIIMPNKLNAGEIVTRVVFFAPISLLFFFVVLLFSSIVLHFQLHPMHYFFLAATFFSFHLMYAYFSDHMNLYLSFTLASFISLVLTITYLRLCSKKLLAYIFAPLIQLIYLVVFSFSFFFDGMTGLLVTIFSVITLFILMQITGNIDWDKTLKLSA